MSFGTVGLYARLWSEKGLKVILADAPPAPDSSLLQYGRRLVSPPRRGRIIQSPSLPPRSGTRTQPSSPEHFREPPLHESVAPLVWPKEWETLRTEAKPGKVVWTYAELGNDLQHRATSGQDERRAFLRRLLSAKPTFPQGTHTFWPYCLREEDVADANAYEIRNLFWAGVHSLGGRIVIVLGQKAASFLLGKTLPYTQMRTHGVHVTVFQDIAQLNGDSALYEKMERMMRSVLRRFGGIG